VGGVADRAPGRYTVYVATTEAAFANGNDAADAMEYRRVFDSSQVMGAGESIPMGNTVTARFAPVLGRYVKIVFTNAGVGIDEVEVRGCDPSTTSCRALPTGNGTTCNDRLSDTSGDVCADGACVGTACGQGLADCDGMASNACEVDTRTSSQHCGACGNACAQNLFCVAGACTPPTSCADLRARNPSAVSGTYAIDPDGAGGAAPFTVVCDMTTDGGGWTLALKANGANTTFAYDAALWTNTALLNPTALDLGPTEAKFASFLNQRVTQVLVVMTAGGQTRSLVLDAAAPSLSAARVGQLPRHHGGPHRVAQPPAGQHHSAHCNREGFVNAFADPHGPRAHRHPGQPGGRLRLHRLVLGVGGNILAGNGCFGGETRPSVGQVGGGSCSPAGALVTATAQVYVRALPQNCQQLQPRGGTTERRVHHRPRRPGAPSPSRRCSATRPTTAAAGPSSAASATRATSPTSTRNLGALTAPGGTGNLLHTNFAAITGTAVRVGRQVGTGTNVGNFYQINDCSSGDAACWYGRYINQNDGDTFGAWLTAGGNWGFVPGGCTSDQCPTNGGDRDHSVAQRIAIFGGDCHASCNNGVDDVRNGLVYRDYGDADEPLPRRQPAPPGATGTVTSGATALGTQISIVDYGQGGAQWRDLWIR
jgi:hypothetical protein